MARGLEFIHVELKRDTWLRPEKIVATDDDAVDVVQDLLENLDREMVVCINRAYSGKVINASICSVGTMNMALVSPSEILRSVLLSGAGSFIMLHNHPSGNVYPSSEDLESAKRMANAAALMGVEFLDSIILGENGKRFSIRRHLPEYIMPTDQTVGISNAAAPRADYVAEAPEGMKEMNKLVKESYVVENRKAVVNQMIDLIESGKFFYSRQWSTEALRPRNPVSGTIYHGSNRMTLMQKSLQNGYKDPRWLTFKQLSEQGYYIRKGERATRLEKWTFTEKKAVRNEDGSIVKDANGKTVYKDVLLDRPRCNLFSVFNGEQIRDFPRYEPPVAAKDEIGKKIQALIASSECRVNELAQDRSFYSPSVDEIFLPLRSAFRDQNAFAEVLAHEMIHSTGHSTRLNREFGIRGQFGKPDRNYCMEELRAELGAMFLLGDAGIPLPEAEKKGSAAYLDGYLQVLKENPNLLFRIASDADKASNYLFENFCRKYSYTPQIEMLPGRKPDAENIQKEKDRQKSQEGQKIYLPNCAKQMPVL